MTIAIFEKDRDRERDRDRDRDLNFGDRANALILKVIQCATFSDFNSKAIFLHSLIILNLRRHRYLLYQTAHVFITQSIVQIDPKVGKFFVSRTQHLFRDALRIRQISTDAQD